MAVTEARSIAVANLNGDAYEDILYVDAGSDELVWALSDGTDLDFAFGSALPTGARPIHTATGDLDGDGDRDVVVVNHDGRSISVYRQTRRRADALSKLVDDVSVEGMGAVRAEDSYHAAIADMDADGDLDVVVANRNESTDVGSVSILLNDGDAGFSLAPGTPLAVRRVPTAVAIADLNGDGAMDIVTAHDYLDVDTAHISVLLAQP